jgi:hypothetical protein
MIVLDVHVKVEFFDPPACINQLSIPQLQMLLTPQKAQLLSMLSCCFDNRSPGLEESSSESNVAALTYQ